MAELVTSLFGFLPGGTVNQHHNLFRVERRAADIKGEALYFWRWFAKQAAADGGIAEEKPTALAKGAGASFFRKNEATPCLAQGVEQGLIDGK